MSKLRFGNRMNTDLRQRRIAPLAEAGYAGR